MYYFSCRFVQEYIQNVLLLDTHLQWPALAIPRSPFALFRFSHAPGCRRALVDRARTRRARKAPTIRSGRQRALPIGGARALKVPKFSQRVERCIRNSLFGEAGRKCEWVFAVCCRCIREGAEGVLNMTQVLTGFHCRNAGLTSSNGSLNGATADDVLGENES